MILIMKAQVLFFNDFSEKDPHLNAVELEILLPEVRSVLWPPAPPTSKAQGAKGLKFLLKTQKILGIC